MSERAQIIDKLVEFASDYMKKKEVHDLLWPCDGCKIEEKEASCGKQANVIHICSKNPEFQYELYIEKQRQCTGVEEFMSEIPKELIQAILNIAMRQRIEVEFDNLKNAGNDSESLEKSEDI